MLLLIKSLTITKRRLIMRCLAKNELITSLGIYSSSCNLKHVSQPYSCSVWDELHWSNGLGANNAQLFKLRICIIFGTLTLMYIVDVINKILTRYLNFSGNRLSMALKIQSNVRQKVKNCSTQSIDLKALRSDFRIGGEKIVTFTGQ